MDSPLGQRPMLGPWCLACALSVLSVLGASTLTGEARAQRDDAIYQYRQDTGRVVYVNGLDRVPPEYRAIATRVSGASTPPTEDVYHYRAEGGRSVYVGALDQVPEAHRATVEEVDLTEVSLNQELARDLSAQLDRQYEALITSPFCEEARRAESMSWLGALWAENGHLVVILGAILALLLLTPWAVRRFTPGTWSRVLLFAVPVLLFVAVMTHAVVRTSAIRESLLASASECQPDGSSAVGGVLEVAQHRQGSIRTLRERMQHLNTLRDRQFEALETEWMVERSP